MATFWDKNKRQEKTLYDARQELEQRKKEGVKSICPCCTQNVKLYPYNMGEIYIQQLAHLEMVGGWVKGTDLIFHTVGGYRKYGFLRWWGILVSLD